MELSIQGLERVPTRATKRPKMIPRLLRFLEAVLLAIVLLNKREETALL